MSKKSSVKVFKKGLKVKVQNFKKPMRGGIRL